MRKNSFEETGPTPSQLGIEGKRETRLTAEEMLEKIQDPSFLPSYKELARHLKKIGGRSGYFDLERAEWHGTCFNKEHPIFEFWTEEYIHTLGDYLAKRSEKLGGSEENPLTILEVGAGDGRLTHFLQEKMDELIPGKAKIIATDSGEYKISPDFPVESIPHKEALEKYKPKIIIFSWMPYEYDCTSDFRAMESVDEYILIGEADGGCCGDEWETWGVSYLDEERDNQTPPYEKDGFEKIYQSEMSELQLSRVNISEGKSTSCTFSFMRKG